jgi:hypothetical protein
MLGGRDVGVDPQVGTYMARVFGVVFERQIEGGTPIPNVVAAEVLMDVIQSEAEL